MTGGAESSRPLVGRCALVTGGNGGIGLGMAAGLIDAGADVAVWGTNVEKNEHAVAQLRARRNAVVHAERCDIREEASVDAAFAGTVAALGHIDAVFANAGISGSAPDVAAMSLEEWRRVLEVNLDGTFLTLRAAARYLIERGEGGALVVVSSTSAIHGAAAMPHYGTSKTALLGLTRALAVQLARHRIRVNALLPGWTDTELVAGPAASRRFVEATIGRTPVRRWAAPEEFGPVAAWLADPSHTFHTGDAVVVDGGYTIF